MEWKSQIEPLSAVLDFTEVRANLHNVKDKYKQRDKTFSLPSRQSD